MAIGYVEMASAAFAPAGSAGWEDYDIFTNLSVPKGAVAEILIGNFEVDTENEGGVRADGSGLARLIDLMEAEDGGATWVSMFVQVHAGTGLIEIYAEDHLNMEFRCVGYFTGCTFTEAYNRFLAPAVSAWANIDLFTLYGAPKGSVVQMVASNELFLDDETMGVRADGSGLLRRVILQEAEDGGGNPVGFVVKTDSSTGIIEVWTTDNVNTAFYYLGYFDAGVDFTEAWSSYGPGADTTWENEDLSGDAIPPPANGIIYFAIIHRDVDNELECGARSNGSALDRKYDVRESEGESFCFVGFGITVNVDASKILELYCEDATYGSYFYYEGYFFDFVPGWTGKISGVTNPAEVAGVAVADIAEVKGVA